jgi:mannose-1-phosphate guanylyltransferase
MLVETLERLRGLVDSRDRWIVTARDLEGEAAGLARDVPRAQVIGEPVGRNTAPAIGLVSRWLAERGPDSVVVVLPSDHRVEPAARFREECERAARAALERSAIVTLGIPPTRPETGYGYIETGEAIAPGSPIHRVSAFREKPDGSTAERYLADGRHLWNAGVFVFAPQVMLEEIRRHEPRLGALLAALPRFEDPALGSALEAYYREAPSISIDYAVMERTDRALVARAGFSWDDLGSWEAIRASRGRSVLEDCRDVVAYSEGGLVAALGVEDLIIVRTPDVTLVCRRDRAQEVRAIVERIKQRKDLDEYL